VDLSSEKISKVKRLNLYDELHVANIQDFNPKIKFDTLMALEVLHGLQAEVLTTIESFVKEKGSIILALPSLPKGMSVEDLIKRGYDVYRYLLRGLILVDLKRYEIHLAGHSTFLKMIKFILTVLKPLLRITGSLKRGYLLAFKQDKHEKVPLKALSALISKDHMFSLTLFSFNSHLEARKRIASVNGSTGFIYKAEGINS